MCECSICTDCQYLGDKYSFPMPNDLIDVDEKNPMLKHYYCCCGDSDQYQSEISLKKIRECDCFEKL